MNLVCAYCGIQFQARGADSQRDYVSSGLHTWEVWAALMLFVVGLVVYLVAWRG